MPSLFYISYVALDTYYILWIAFLICTYFMKLLKSLFKAGRTNANSNPNEGCTGSFIEETTCESSLISSRNSSIDSHVRQQLADVQHHQNQQIANFQMKPQASPNR